MDLDRIKRLEESVLALQLENSPKQTDSDVIARLTSLEASVLQEKAMKGEFKRKLKFANNQNSRLILRLKKEKVNILKINFSSAVKLGLFYAYLSTLQGYINSWEIQNLTFPLKYQLLVITT